MKLLPSRRVLCAPYNHVPCHFMQIHIRKVHANLTVTCHLHFWQNHRGLLLSLAGAATSIIFVAKNTCLSRQKTRLLPRQKYACRDKPFVATNICRNKHNFVATNVWLSRQKYFVATNVSSPQTRLCLSFVATKMILVSAPANDTLRATAVTPGGTDTKIRVSKGQKRQHADQTLCTTT